jgi:hypothetical protein
MGLEPERYPTDDGSCMNGSNEGSPMMSTLSFSDAGQHDEQTRSLASLDGHERKRAKSEPLIEVQQVQHPCAQISKLDDTKGCTTAHELEQIPFKRGSGMYVVDRESSYEEGKEDTQLPQGHVHWYPCRKTGARIQTNWGRSCHEHQCRKLYH